MTPKEKKDQKVGDVLRAEREQRGIKQSIVELDTKIRGKYLTKLEESDYSIPNDVYIRGFVQAYGNYLGLDGAALAKQYEAERGGLEKPERSAPKPVKQAKVSLTPRLLIVGATLLILVGVIGYLATQFSALAAAPHLDVTSPVADQAITGAAIDVTGKATPGADVFINNSSVITDADGNFTDHLALTDGLNVISIVAKNKLGKQTVVTRNILAHLPVVKAKPTLLVPAKVFNGVAVGIKIKDKATVIQVTVDGKVAFNGTMQAGTSKSFSGKTDIKITTADAGSTALVVTNFKVANKSIDPVGKAGETKRDLDFTKTTVIK